jgi:hypothetical protein
MLSKIHWLTALQHHLLLRHTYKNPSGVLLSLLSTVRVRNKRVEKIILKLQVWKKNCDLSFVMKLKIRQAFSGRCLQSLSFSLRT